MPRQYLSAVHSLSLIPVSKLLVFACVGGGVRVVCLDAPEDAGAIPGSVKISSTESSGIIKKTMTYKCQSAGAPALLRLEGYRASRLVAFYVDETGARRAAGSPDFPLRFSFTFSDGVFSCKLEGDSLTEDPFVI